jgi:arylesterase / paraoxonase
MNILNASARVVDYVATYDPATSKVTRLAFSGFTGARGYSSHGMDVVPSATNPNELFVYLINQRPPREEHRVQELFTDSSVEIFKTTVGSSILTHIRTVEDPAVFKSPNDVVGSSDGESFWFTNDGTHRRQFVSCQK